MKNILAISLLIVLFAITNSYVYGDSSDTPVVITKVELWSLPTFAEEVNLCQDGKTLGPWSYQWIELSNLRNETIIMTEVELNFTRGPAITMNGFSLDPNESCLIQTADQVTTRIGPGGSEGNGPPSGYDGSLVSIQYIIKTGSMITRYQDSTTELSDTFGDTRVWQLIDGKWTFKEYVIPDVKRIVLSKTIDDDLISVNLTLAEEMQPPLMTKFKVDFMDGMKNHLNNVKYEITYSGVDQIKQNDNGFAVNGTDIKFMEFTQPDSIIIAINILGIDGKIFDKPQTVEFSPIIIGGTNKSLYYPLLSPLKQFKDGISIDEVKCREGLILIQKHDGSPACVKEQSIPKLVERGWTHN